MKFLFLTLGCKVNQFESQAMASLLAERGHSLAAEGETPDAVVINTCAVTAESGRKSRQAVRRLMGEYPAALAAVCGCWAQIAPEEAKSLGADVVFGSGDRLGLIEALERAEKGRSAVFSVDDALSRREFEFLPSGSGIGRTRAMLKVQDGCRNFCTYCVIPYARGPVRSLPLEKAEAEAARLGREGYREIVVTGIEIASWGLDLHMEGARLPVLARSVCRAAPEARIRLGSLEPRTVTEEFCSLLSGEKNLCPHFHLSLQSGSDATLRRMGRKYDTARFYESVRLLREAFPGCGLTSDLIAGFPGESEDEFSETLAFIKRCGFSAMHIFPYSRRPGTKAAQMPGQLPLAVKKDRCRAAAVIAAGMKESFLLSQLGRETEVLFENLENGLWRGLTGNYCEAEAAGEALHGRVLRFLPLKTENGRLVGKIL